MALICPDQQFFLHGIHVLLQKIEYFAEWVDTASERLYSRAQTINITLSYIMFLATRHCGSCLRPILCHTMKTNNYNKMLNNHNNAHSDNYNNSYYKK